MESSFSQRFFLLLSSLFIASLVVGNLIFQKFFSFSFFGYYTFELSVGVLPYPVTFLVTDILSEFYGERKARQVVFAGFLANLFVLAVISLAMALPQAVSSPLSDVVFHQVFGLHAPAVAASMVAYLIAQLIDIRLFHFWRKYTGGKHLWLRNNASTIVSQLIDTAVVLALLCSVQALPWEQFFPLLVGGFLFKAMLALFDTPFFYLAVYLLQKRGVEQHAPA